MIVYKTTNLINGKIYIVKDKHDNTKYLGSGLLLKKAIRKNGLINFKKETIEICDTVEYLNEREIFWIAHYKSTDINIGYNIAVGGFGGDTFTNNPNKEEIRVTLSKRRHTDASKKKISENSYNTLMKGENHFNNGRIQSKEEKQKRKDTFKRIGGSMLNKHHSVESKQKIRNKKLGRTNTKESNDKRSITMSLKNKLQCPHCGKIVGNPKRWHFDNCKNKPIDNE